MQIWDSPSNKKNAAVFFQDHGILPKTRVCGSGHEFKMYKMYNSKCIQNVLGNKYFGSAMFSYSKKKSGSRDNGIMTLSDNPSHA